MRTMELQSISRSSRKRLASVGICLSERLPVGKCSCSPFIISGLDTAALFQSLLPFSHKLALSLLDSVLLSVKETDTFPSLALKSSGALRLKSDSHCERYVRLLTVRGLIDSPLDILYYLEATCLTIFDVSSLPWTVKCK